MSDCPLKRRVPPPQFTTIVVGAVNVATVWSAITPRFASAESRSKFCEPNNEQPIVFIGLVRSDVAFVIVDVNTIQYCPAGTVSVATGLERIRKDTGGPVTVYTALAPAVPGAPGSP